LRDGMHFNVVMSSQITNRTGDLKNFRFSHT
jgi:hypothetical protein